ncbi:hypothetical protein ACFYE9_25190 [Rhizobium leguminosarum]|uniref:hypothetical protein n=1 Tax=Rhizobium leguminosarum TaxID=384 RepID=UPI000AADFC61|nr:hypothetical protein [Rhizobium leguminosarum]
MVITFRDDGAVLALKDARRRGHIKRIRRHQESDDENLSVAEYAPKSHSAGFPFHHRTARQQQCSKISEICGGPAFWQPGDEEALTVAG